MSRSLVVSFKPEMLQTIREDLKTVTRRPVDPQPVDVGDDPEVPAAYLIENADRAHDSTWNGCGPSRKDLYFDESCEVTEFLTLHGDHPYKVGDMLAVKEDSSLMLLVKRVTAELLHQVQRDIDAKEEGVPTKEEFQAFWDTIYEKKPWFQWKNNPWVWVIEFQRAS